MPLGHSTITQQSENPFESTERWEVSTDSMLGAGNHRVRIVSVESASSSTGNPKAILRLENPEGFINAFEPYHEGFLNKIASLYDAAGVQVPQVGEFDPNDHCRISEQALSRLVGKEVGIVVKDEPDFKDSSKTWPRVQGYVDAARVDGGPDTRGLPEQKPASSSVHVTDDDVPF